MLLHFDHPYIGASTYHSYLKLRTWAKTSISKKREVETVSVSSFRSAVIAVANISFYHQAFDNSSTLVAYLHRFRGCKVRHSKIHVAQTFQEPLLRCVSPQLSSLSWAYGSSLPGGMWGHCSIEFARAKQADSFRLLDSKREYRE